MSEVSYLYAAFGKFRRRQRLGFLGLFSHPQSLRAAVKARRVIDLSVIQLEVGENIAGPEFLHCRKFDISETFESPLSKKLKSVAPNTAKGVCEDSFYSSMLSSRTLGLDRIVCGFLKREDSDELELVGAYRRREVTDGWSTQSEGIVKLSKICEKFDGVSFIAQVNLNSFLKHPVVSLDDVYREFGLEAAVIDGVFKTEEEIASELNLE
jgi:hypothetical protein